MVFRFYILLIIVLLSACAKDSEKWNRFNAINSGSEPISSTDNLSRLSYLHHKGSENNFVYGPYSAAIQDKN